MTEELQTGGPAFPAKASINRDTGEFIPHQFGNDDFVLSGMSLRQYAAIKLRVPKSGTDWLDDMIRESQRVEFAKAAMQTLLATEYISANCVYVGWENSLRGECFRLADAMLREQEKGNG